MSLVAYGNSSDEDDDDQISDEDEIMPMENGNQTSEPTLKLHLPKPVVLEPTTAEDDDEFLRKKATPIEKPPPAPKRGPVRITIPALSQFQGDEDRKAPKKDTVLPVSAEDNLASRLLRALPKPKSEQLFFSSSSSSSKSTAVVAAKPLLVPHSVKNRKPTAQTTVTRKKDGLDAKASALLSGDEASDDEADDSADFFSLNREDKLPEISKNEIVMMVAKRAAKISENAAKFDQLISVEPAADLRPQEEFHGVGPHRQQSQPQDAIDEQALQSLIGGSRAKRAKMSDVQMVDLSHDQIMPDRDDWMRTALSSSTEAKVRGELKDGPKGVAKKKHQITYLAHQAKSNEAELQAIWSSNRQSKRQTQSKYGF